MGIKKIFEKIGFGDKDIEIDRAPIIPRLMRDPQEIPDLAKEVVKDPSYASFYTKVSKDRKATEGGEQDSRATRRWLFESKIIKVIALAAGLEIFGYSKSLEQYYPSPQVEQYKKDYNELSKKLGPQFDAFLAEMETYKAQKERVSEDIYTEVGDFEEADASNQEVKSYLENGYPQKWLTHVRGVRMVPFDLDVPEEYSLKEKNAPGKAKAVANIVGRGELGGSTITFSKEITNFLNSVSHELGHANDWLGRTDLPDEYRINLFYNVVKRVESPDRFKSAYVESITNKDPQKQLEYKATEYWAEIVGEYMDHPKEAKTKLPPADVALIERHLQISAPNFDVEKAVIAREARGKIIKQGIIEKQIKLAITDSQLANGDALLDSIKKWAMVENWVADIKDGSLPDEEQDDDEEEVILADIFSHGNKKWSKANQAFLDSMGRIDSLALIYKEAASGFWTARSIKADIKTYQQEIKKVEKEMKKFSFPEQEKIKKFHHYLEQALREAEIFPSSVTPSNYYK